MLDHEYSHSLCSSQVFIGSLTQRGSDRSSGGYKLCNLPLQLLSVSLSYPTHTHTHTESLAAHRDETLCLSIFMAEGR